MTLQNFTARPQRNACVDWTPLRKVETEKNCYVEFYVKHPLTGKMVRKRVKFNQFGTGQKRDNAIHNYIRNTTAKLLSGWNPLTDDSNELRLNVPLSEVRQDYERCLELEGKRPKTLVDYKNRMKLFCRWASHSRLKLIGECTTARVEEFLHYKLVKQGVSATARNNYRTWLSSFFTWCISRHYIAENPCAKIKMLREPPKKRRVLTGEELARIANYFLQTDRYMLLAVMMQYYTLIRPGELLKLHIRDINFDEQFVVVPGEYSKNHKEQPVALNDRLLSLMQELGIDRTDPDAWLFGNGCRPSYIPGGHDIFRFRWAKMRKELGLPEEVQFYGLKDTGIVDLINAEGVLHARDQARHSSISVTNLYTKYGSRTAHESTKHFVGQL